MKKSEVENIGESEIFAVRKTIPAGRIYEMHSHDYIEAELILSGKSDHVYNSEVSELTEGHAYIVTHHDLHAFRAIEDTELFSIGFDISILDKESADILSFITNKKLCCVFQDNELNDITTRFASLVQETDSSALLSKSLCRALITEITVEIVRRSDNISSHSPSVSQKVLEYIHTGFKDELSLGLLAEKLNLTQNYIGRIFYQDVGVSFNNYLNRTRLRYACNMLLFSDIPIGKIGLMSGYSSVEYFFYIFKKELSLTPQEYRQINSKKLNGSSLSANAMLK